MPLKRAEKIHCYFHTKLGVWIVEIRWAEPKLQFHGDTASPPLFPIRQITIYRFAKPEGAREYIRQYYAKRKLWEKAQLKIQNVKFDLLNTEEFGMLKKCIANAEITKKQYGWLSGILERQKL